MLTNTLEELLTYNPPSEYDPEKKKNCVGGYIVPVEESQVLANLLRSILKYDPKERPSVETILEHPWFKT
jgi:serine/threonine protein kinase